MKTIVRPFFYVLFVSLLIISCTDTKKKIKDTDTSSNTTIVEDNRPAELKELDGFFDVIINSDYKSFKKEKIDNVAMLKFGVYYWYNFKVSELEKTSSNDGRPIYKIKNTKVKDIVNEYFGTEITEYKTFDEIEYKDGNFLLDGSKNLGLMDNPSAQCLDLTDKGNGIYFATVGELFQEVTYSNGPKYRATLKKVDNRYILTDFQEIK